MRLISQEAAVWGSASIKTFPALSYLRRERGCSLLRRMGQFGREIAKNSAGPGFRSLLQLPCRFASFLLIVSLCLCTESTFAQIKPKEKPPQVERITDSVYRVGAATVDTQAQTVTCKGIINMDAGAVEYLAVTPKGKLHESLLRVDVRPLHLQVALLLLGLEGKNVLKRQGERTTPQGDPVEIRVRWREKSGTQRDVLAETLLLEMPKNRPMPAEAWVFTGSRILKEGFEADLEGSLVAVWHDPAAILDNRAPGGGNNGWIVYTKHVPKRGTPIEIVFRPGKKA